MHVPNWFFLSNDAELALVQGNIIRCKTRITVALALVTPKDEIFAILRFFAWLAEPHQDWNDVIKAISQLESTVNLTWNFSTLMSAITRLDEKTQPVAKNFLAFFEGYIDLPTLKTRLEEEKTAITPVNALPLTPPTETDDDMLIQWALQLQELRSDLFGEAQGVLILNITENSQADKHGLRRGDIVIAYDEQPMNNVMQLISAIQTKASGPQVKLRFIRADTMQTVVLKGGKVGIELINITSEIPSQQFWEKFVTTVQTGNDEDRNQLVIDNPNTSEQVQKLLSGLIESTEKEDEKEFYRAFGQMLEVLRQVMPIQHFMQEFATAVNNKNMERVIQLLTNKAELLDQVQHFLRKHSKEIPKQQAQQLRKEMELIGKLRKYVSHLARLTK